MSASGHFQCWAVGQSLGLKVLLILLDPVAESPLNTARPCRGKLDCCRYKTGFKVFAAGIADFATTQIRQWAELMVDAVFRGPCP